MPLREFPAFHDLVEDLDREALTRAMHQAQVLAGGQSCPLYLGFLPSCWPAPVDEISCAVDAFFTLGPEFGFERRDAILTVGLHQSRFALILMWEALHVLRPGGLWVDVERADQLGDTVIGASEVLERPYFRHCLELVHRLEVGGLIARIFRKQRPTLVAPRIAEEGWTFGILTSGPSENACRMVREIRDLGLPDYEILICGPDPGPLPPDAPVRRFDLDPPEPRGWITRKKNQMAEQAQHENLCLLHDRFVIPTNFVSANRRMGATQGITTFPTLFRPEPSKSVFFRYVDYQCTRPTARTFLASIRLVNFRLDQFCYPQYNDWREGCHINGGAYIARRALWQAVPQDETLYHGDWEDVLHGIACHRYGIPQRVNPHAIFESVYAHHAPLNRFTLPHLLPDGRVEQRNGYESAAFLALRALAPTSLAPIGRTTWGRMAKPVLDLLPRLPAAVGRDLRAAAGTPADVAALWKALEDLGGRAQPRTREEVSALLEMVRRCAASPVWHPNHTQQWLRQIELHPERWQDLVRDQRMYFRLLAAIYPSFFDAREEGERDQGSQSRWAGGVLCELHWHSPGARGMLRAATSLGECPVLAHPPAPACGVPLKTAVLAIGLVPVARGLGSPRAARIAKRMVRLARRVRSRLL
jgi:hypothetical protein